MITIPRGTWSDHDEMRPGPFWIGPVRRFKAPTAEKLAILGEIEAWKAENRERLPDTTNVVCGNGHAGLIDEHVIADDGTVSPSVVCTEENCGWHEHIQLDRWSEREKPPW